MATFTERKLTPAGNTGLPHGQLFFIAPPYPERRQFGGPLAGLSFSVSRAGQVLLVTFARPLRSLAASTVAARYTINGPSTITASSVSFTPGNAFLSVTTTGSYAPGTYTLLISDQTTQALQDDTFNSTLGVTFSGVEISSHQSFFRGFD